MIEDHSLRTLLRATLAAGDVPSQRDLWPEVARRLEARPVWSAFDMGLAALVALALLVFPEGLWVMAFHL